MPDTLLVMLSKDTPGAPLKLSAESGGGCYKFKDYQKSNAKFSNDKC